MARQKQIGWKMLVATALLSALFVVGGLVLTGRHAAAADAGYVFISPTRIVDAAYVAGLPGGQVFNKDTSGPYGFTALRTAPNGTPFSLRLTNFKPNGAAQFVATLSSSVSAGTNTVSVGDPHYYGPGAQNPNDPVLAAKNACLGIGGSWDATKKICNTAKPKADCEAKGGAWDTTKTPPVCNPNASTDPSLECNVTFSPLTWVLCPIVKLTNMTLNTLDNVINNLLTVDQVKIFDTSKTPGSGYYAAWKTFRGFALAILVISGLAMVIAQGLGFEVLDAYTIKKILPRLIFAIIGIALSWELMKFFVILTNDLGLGIRRVIYAPFNGLPNHVQLGGGAEFLANLLGGAAILAMGIGALLSFVLTAALALLVAFLVLIVRQLVIIVLILFAPIAIACSILPNTQSVFKLWHESFTKAMMMFPIIVAFLAIGRVFAVTSVASDISNVSAVSQLIAFAAYILPYFMIPFTFRFAGGAMRTLGGGLNDRSRGGFDRLKKYRGNKTAQNMQAMKSGNRFRGNSKLARGFNSTSKAIATAPSAGLDPRSMRSRYNQAKGRDALAEAEKIRSEDPNFAVGAQDDRLLRATEGKGRADIRKRLMAEGITNTAELDTATSVVEGMQHSGSRQAVAAAVAVQRWATGTGYDDKNGEVDFQDAFDTIKRASGGDAVMAGRLVGMTKGVAAQAGQLSYGGASYSTLRKGMQQSLNGETVDGDAVALDAFMSTDAMSAARGRTKHVKRMTKAVNDRINEVHSGTGKQAEDGELGRLTAQLESFQQTIGVYGAPDRQTVVNMEVPNSAKPRYDVKVQVQQHAAAPGANIINPLTGIPINPGSADVASNISHTGGRGGYDPRRDAPEENRDDH